jgi:putative phage tail protein p028 [bacillus phage SPP1]
MIKTSLLPLQIALFKRLKETGYKVFDYVEHSTEYPYLAVGTPETKEFITKTNFGEEVIFTIHAWSNYKGKKECYEMLDSALKTISKKYLELNEEFKVFKTEMLTLTVFDDIDGRTQHGILRLKFYIKEN